MSDSKQRKLGVILSYFSIIVNTLIQLIYTPFLIKMLGQSEYGLYSLVSSIIGYLTVLDLGFGNAIVVYTSKYRALNKTNEEKRLHGMFFYIFCIIGVIAALLGIIFFLNISNIFGNTMTEIELKKVKIMMIILIFNLAISFPFSIYSSILNAYEQFTFQKIVSIINSLIKPLIMIPLLFLGYKSITMAVVITIVNIAVMISNCLYCKNKLKIKIKYQGFDKKLFKEIFSYSFFVFLAVIVDKINWSVDQFVLGAISGTIAVSIYSVASQLNSLFISLSTAVSGVLLPKMSKLVASNASDSKLTNEFIKVGRIQYLLIFLMASGLVIFGKQFIILWVGEQFTDSYYVALLLILPLCIPLIQNLGLSIMQAKNKFKFRTICMVIMSIFNLIISIFLAKKYGPIGSAVGTAISLIVINVFLMNIYYYKVIKINVIKFWKSIIKMTIPFIIPVSLILIIMKLISFTPIVNIIIFASLYSLMYFLIAYLFSMNEYERGIIKNILKRLNLIK